MPFFLLFAPVVIAVAVMSVLGPKLGKGRVTRPGHHPLPSQSHRVARMVYIGSLIFVPLFLIVSILGEQMHPSRRDAGPDYGAMALLLIDFACCCVSPFFMTATWPKKFLMAGAGILLFGLAFVAVVLLFSRVIC